MLLVEMMGWLNRSTVMWWRGVEASIVLSTFIHMEERRQLKRMKGQRKMKSSHGGEFPKPNPSIDRWALSPFDCHSPAEKRRSRWQLESLWKLYKKATTNFDSNLHFFIYDLWLNCKLARCECLVLSSLRIQSWWAYKGANQPSLQVWQ